MTMTTISRRKFLASAALSVAATRLDAQSHAGVKVNLTIPNEAGGPHMPSTSSASLMKCSNSPTRASSLPQNAGLIRAFKALAPHGVLRLGGNTSEFAWWKPTADSPEPEHPQIREVVGEPKAQYYAVTPEAVHNLGGFLERDRMDLPVWNRNGHQHARAGRGGG